MTSHTPIDMRAVVVREARVDDEPDASHIERLTIAALRRIYRPTPATIERRASVTPQLTRLVAVLDDRIVGVVQYYPRGDDLCLVGLGVHPQWQRRGLATMLIRHLEGIGRTGGRAALQLHTIRQTGNVPIFERLGFTVASEAETDLFVSDHGVTLTEVVMRKSLV